MFKADVRLRRILIEDLFLNTYYADEFHLTDLFHQCILHHMNKECCRHLYITKDLIYLWWLHRSVPIRYINIIIFISCVEYLFYSSEYLRDYTVSFCDGNMSEWIWFRETEKPIRAFRKSFDKYIEKWKRVILNYSCKTIHNADCWDDLKRVQGVIYITKLNFMFIAGSM